MALTNLLKAILRPPHSRPRHVVGRLQQACPAAVLEERVVDVVDRSSSWFLTEADDQAQDELIGDFRRYIASTIPKAAASLEVGPSHNPILPKAAGYQVTIVDHDTQTGLIEKYAAHGVNLSNIEPVDVVWDGNDVAESLGGKKFDAVVASHVIEHAPDFIQFLKDWTAALSEDGRIYLLVPDKRYCFDFMNSVSDVAKVLSDHRQRRTRHSYESLYRQSVCVGNGGDIAWGQSGVKNLKFLHGDPNHIRQVAEGAMSSEAYVDAHENYFTPISFLMLMDELQYLREVALDVSVITRARGCEFLVVLQKERGRPEIGPDEFMGRKLGRYALLMAEERERLLSCANLLEH